MAQRAQLASEEAARSKVPSVAVGVGMGGCFWLSSAFLCKSLGVFKIVFFLLKFFFFFSIWCLGVFVFFWFYGVSLFFRVPEV